MEDWDQQIDNVLFAYRVLQQETMDEPDLETKIAKMIELQKKLHDQAQFEAKHNSLTKLLTSSSPDNSIVIPVLR